MFKELAPALAMTMAGLSRDPRAVQNTANAWQMGTNQARYREKQEKDDRKQQETMKALAELHKGGYDNLYDAAGVMLNNPNADPVIVSTFLRDKKNFDFQKSMQATKAALEMSLLKTRQEGDLAVEGVRQGGMDRRAAAGNKNRINVANINQAGANARNAATNQTTLDTTNMNNSTRRGIAGMQDKTRRELTKGGWKNDRDLEATRQGGMNDRMVYREGAQNARSVADREQRAQIAGDRNALEKQKLELLSSDKAHTQLVMEEYKAGKISLEEAKKQIKEYGQQLSKAAQWLQSYMGGGQTPARPADKKKPAKMKGRKTGTLYLLDEDGNYRDESGRLYDPRNEK